MKSSIVKEFEKRLRFSGFLSVLQQGMAIPCQLLFAALTAGMITSAVAGEGNAVLRQGALLFGSVFLYKLLDALITILYNRELIKAKQDCRMRLYSWYMENPLYQLYDFQQGKFLERVTDDFNTAARKFYKVITGLLLSFLAAGAYFLYIGRADWRLALLFLLFALLQAVPELVIKRMKEQVYEDERDIEAEVTEWMVAAYRGFSTIKSFNLTEWYMERLKKLHDENTSVGNRSIGMTTAESSAQQLITYLLRYGGCVGAGLFVLWGRLSLKDAVGAISISASFFSAVKELFTVIPEFATANVAQKRMEEWKSKETDARVLTDGKGIHLQDVSFSYGEKQVLCRKSEILETDGICMIKGENGCGKSTLLKLIAGLLSCDSGCISVGRDVAETKKQLEEGQGIWYLSQERLHIDMTVKEYIGLFQKLDRQAFQENLRVFHIDDALLQSRLNELSGGEEKKIMLSVLLAAGIPLLLLDEPETSLDAEGMQVLVQKLKERGRGVLLVTHGEMFDSIADQCCQM